MTEYSNKLNLIAKHTNQYLKDFFLKQNKKSYLTKPMKYGLFSGGKRFRSAIVVSIGKIFEINYKELIIVGSAMASFTVEKFGIEKLIELDKSQIEERINEFKNLVSFN